MYSVISGVFYRPSLCWSYTRPPPAHCEREALAVVTESTWNIIFGKVAKYIFTLILLEKSGRICIHINFITKYHKICELCDYSHSDFQNPVLKCVVFLEGNVCNNVSAVNIINEL